MVVESKVLPITIEAAGAMPQTNDSPLTDGLGTARLQLDKGTQDFAVPAFRVFDIEDCVQSEVEALFGWDAEPLQPGINKTRSCWRRHLDHAESTN